MRRLWPHVCGPERRTGVIRSPNTSASAANVTVVVDEKENAKKWDRYVMTVSNANPFPITFEAEFDAGGYTKHDSFTGTVKRKKGKDIWRAIIPANGSADIGYRVSEIEAE